MVVKSDGSESATMKTQPFHYEGTTCISFWYFSIGNGTAVLNILQRNSPFRRLEIVKGINWQFFHQEIYMKVSDYITFQTDELNKNGVLIGLDDISIVNYDGCRGK